MCEQGTDGQESMQMKCMESRFIMLDDVGGSRE
jgi:hypothetical protein